MKRLNVAILFGGCSSEYEVSLSSAAAVLENLDRDQYNITMVGITREGKWLKYIGSIADIRADRWHIHSSCIHAFLSPSTEVQGLVEIKGNEVNITPVDLVFPILHGSHGEDGTVQGLLELSGIPYVGCDHLSSAICMDKAITHALVKAVGVNTTPSMTVFQDEDFNDVIRNAEKLKFPLYVKPARSGSSIGITMAFHKEELKEAMELAFSHDTKVIIEQHIEGFEVGCAVLGNLDPIIGELDEIELSSGFFNYEEKYSLSTSQIHLPARIDALTADKIKSTALLIYRTLGCKGLARVDLFVTSEGEIVLNEVNTIPGFTAQSRYPNMLSSIGIPFRELLNHLIHLAMSGGINDENIVRTPSHST